MDCNCCGCGPACGIPGAGVGLSHPLPPCGAPGKSATLQMPPCPHLYHEGGNSADVLRWWEGKYMCIWNLWRSGVGSREKIFEKFTDENFPSLIRTEHSQMIQEGPWTPRNLKKTAPRLTVIKETIPQPERSWFFLREGKINRRSKNICVFVTLCLKELREDRNSHSGCWGWADEGWEDGGKETLYHVSFNLINILTDYIFQKITLKNPQTRDMCKQWKFSIFLSPASVPFPRGYHCAGSPRVSC